MPIIQPENATQLKDNHPLMHKVLAIFAGAPPQHVVVDAGGNIFIGDYPHGDYVKISPAGQILLVAGARIRRHLLIDPARFKLPAADYPGESFEGLFYTLDFDKTTEQGAYAQDHIPYRWDTNTDIEVVVRWLHDNADNGKVVWGLEYRAVKTDEVIADGNVTISQASAGNHPAGKLVETIFTTKILKANLERHDQFAVRLFRDVADGADTLGEDARMVDVHFHFTENRLGEAL